jgi:cytidylate kinase
MKSNEQANVKANDNAVAKVIAIDGPSGSGKSTIAKVIAQKLNLTYLDTGAMFRSLAYVLHQLPIDFNKQSLAESEQQQVENSLQKMNFEYGVSSDVLIRIDGKDLTEKIREHEVSAMASKVSKFSVVRDYLAHKQRLIAKERPSILEGRDIGTVIFPNAAVKIFLTASASVRAKRRYEQLIEKDANNKNTYEQRTIEKDIIERDRQDQEREIAPLKKASDAIEIDTSRLSIDQVCAQIIAEYHKQQHLFR